jgi:hypothetical protein
MKYLSKNLSALLFITALFYSSISLEARYQQTYYQMDDDCSQYIPGCNENVIKCALTGTITCVASDQIPCEEACENSNS